MTDPFIKARDLEGQIVDKIVEHNRGWPWHWLRNRKLRRELRELRVRLRAAIDSAARN